MEKNGKISKVSKISAIEENRDNVRRMSVDKIIHDDSGFDISVISKSLEKEIHDIPLDDTMVYVIHEVDLKPSEEEKKVSTSCFNSLGLIKLVETLFAAVTLGCIWSECKMSWYPAEYCYGKSSAFQMQNFPVATCIIALVLDPVILVAWFVTWEQSTPHDDENKYKRKMVAKVDTFLSVVLLFLTVTSVFIEAWMTIKFNVEFSCPICHKLALWSFATILLFLTSGLYIWNLIICNQHHRFNEIVTKKF